MLRFNPFLILKDWLIIFVTRFKNWFFNNLTQILLWLRWKLTFLLKTESRCEFYKSIFKICYALSKLSVDCLLLFNECIQSFLKISSRRGNIRRCISMRILKIMVCFKWWLWSLCIIVTTLPTEIWVISPTRVVCLWVWIMIWPLKTV